ncbi:MAG: DNA repair protein RadC [Acholeplasmataceae bacterium]|nr:DNA repair protein RadC [Acholeplasmataceae bacterium]
MYMIREMAADQRPRERLLTHGAQALSNEELLAILLRSGYQDRSVMDVSRSVISHLASIDDLKRISAEELMTIKGIKNAKATTIVAAIELGRRMTISPKTIKPRIQTPLDVYHRLETRIAHLEQEHFICLYLNTKSEVIKEETLYIGTINQTVIHPREIFRRAVRISSSALIFIHNHPTGDSTPSRADIIATKELQKSGELMGISVVDHIIIGKMEFYSIMAESKTTLT